MTSCSQTYHFIGIGGIGMSALAFLLSQKNYVVSGSDLTQSYVTRALEKNGVKVYLGHCEANLPKEPVSVVYSSAVAQSNPELQLAKKRGLRIIHRADLLSQLLQQEQRSILVGGTHGKTTSSSLLAHTLFFGGLDPSYAVGGFVPTLGHNGRYGTGEYFVAEADESDGSFLKLPAYGSIVTNIDLDHMDYWKTEAELVRGFQKFIDKTVSSEHLFWCGDDDNLSQLALQRGVSYGFSRGNALFIQSFRQDGWKGVMNLEFDGKVYQDILIPLVGKHNALNAAAVFGLCLRLGMAEESIREAFIQFKGVCRRLEKKGFFGDVPIFDDYAHHPVEIAATLQGVKQAMKNGRLVVVFQPHRYSRTRDCLEYYPKAFEEADEVILTEIYSAGEDPIEGVTIEELLRRMRKETAYHVHYVKRLEIATFLSPFLRSHDILVTMGAGNITKVGSELLESGVCV
jgi:UDP-N-acetylmuramate--alanine ligase